MSTRIPLRFWIGRHVDGSGLQCIVDTDGGPMEGVKQAWSGDKPDRLTTLESVVQPELAPVSERLLKLMLRFEKCLGDPTTPVTHGLLQAIAMTSYGVGLRRVHRPVFTLQADVPADAKRLLALVAEFEELVGGQDAPEICRLFEKIEQDVYLAGLDQAKASAAPSL